MRANIVKCTQHNASNGGATTIILCFNRDIHLKINESWHEECGDPENGDSGPDRWDQVRYKTELGPCDCGFGPSVELTAEHEAMIYAYRSCGSSGEDPRLSIEEDRRGKKREGTPNSYLYQRLRNLSVE